jgi:ribosomal protein S18 acetylase RimI-like enzyme
MAQIRETRSSDIAALAIVADLTGLFPGDMLPDMVAGYLAGDTANVWLTCEDNDAAVGFCFARAETLADRTWNMLALAVHPATQGQGQGAALVGSLERRLKASGQRIIIVDTSGTDAFASVRAFYQSQGYVLEARIRDFWGKDDDKVTFWKSLA